MLKNISATTLTRLEKAAVDNGFDQELPRQGNWLGFASSHAPLQLWLSAIGDELFLVAVSQQKVIQALDEHGTAFINPLPEGACGARSVVEIPSLYRLVRRAFQFSKTLPDELLHTFENQITGMPYNTEAD